VQLFYSSHIQSAQSNGRPVAYVETIFGNTLGGGSPVSLCFSPSLKIQGRAFRFPNQHKRERAKRGQDEPVPVL